MTHRVLLPILDFAPWTRAVCRKLADIELATGAQVTLLYPFEKAATERFQSETDGCEPPKDADALARHRVAEAGVDDVLERADIQFDVVGRLHDGEPARAILDVADSEDVDRIYLFSRNRSPVGKATFGSPVQTVLFSADVPIVVVPPASLEYSSTE